MAREQPQISAQVIADHLEQCFGEEALLRAAFCAKKAIDEHDLSSCRTWRDVMHILDLRLRRQLDIN